MIRRSFLHACVLMAMALAVPPVAAQPHAGNNPLRSEPPRGWSAQPYAPATPPQPASDQGSREPRRDVPAELINVLYPPRNSTNPDVSGPTVLDGEATTAGYDTTPTGPTLESLLAESNRQHRAPNQPPETDDRTRTALAAGEGSGAHESFFATLQRIATGTVIVMFLAAGVLVAGRRWLAGAGAAGAVANGGAKGSGTASVEVVARLKLTPKATLFLVAAGDHQVLVASDVSGIQSVVPLTASFAAALEADAHPDGAQSEDRPEGSGTYASAIRPWGGGAAGLEGAATASVGSRGGASSREAIEAEMKRRLTDWIGSPAFQKAFQARS